MLGSQTRSRDRVLEWTAPEKVVHTRPKDFMRCSPSWRERRRPVGARELLAIRSGHLVELKFLKPVLLGTGRA